MKCKTEMAVSLLTALSLICFVVPSYILAIPSVQVPNQEMLTLAKEYNRQEGGQSFLVMHQGKVIFEDYANGGSKEKPLALASGTKSFNGIMALAAIEDGIIKLDEKVCDSLTEWKTDPLKSQITYRHLLTLTSGLEPGTHNNTYKDTWKNVINAPMLGKPGEQFQYGPNHLNSFGEALQRYFLLFYGETYEQYLKRRILDPLSVSLEWNGRFADNNPQVAGGSAITARDWAIFGEWVRNKGSINGKSVIDPSLFDLLTVGTKANPSYGLTWWLETLIKDTTENDWIPKDLFMAAGAGNQRLYIIRSLDLVIVRQAPISNRFHFNDDTFLSLLLKGKEEVETDNFVPEDIEMGNPMVSYIGPEIEPYGNRVVYQVPGENNSLWMGYLDPLTGLFSSKEGKDLLIDTGLAMVEESFQGPEWGVSKKGSTIFYCKKDEKGIMQIWRASLNEKTPKIEQLTHSTEKLYCFFTSQSQKNDSIKVACIRGDKLSGTCVWFDEREPNRLNIIPQVYTWSQCFRFCPDGRYLFYCSNKPGDKYTKDKAQIGMLDTLTSAFTLLTDDPGNKDDPWPFIAPEYGNELCLASTINHQTISIYRNLPDSKGMWTKVATIDTPKESKFKYFFSMEPLQLTSRSKKTSYFSLAAYPDDLGDLVPREESSLWILGLGDKLTRRVDDGTEGQKNEPETWVNQNNVFLYYSYYRLEKTYKKIEMHCCKTGLLEEKPNFLKYQIVFDDTQRTFYITIPDTYNKNQQYPMVLILHGGSGSSMNVMKDTSWDVLAKEKNFIAVFPEGTPIKDEKTGKESPNRYSWNDGSVNNTADDVKFIRQLVSFLLETYSIDKSRIYATGFSNGGAMTFRLAREMDQVFAAIAPVSCSDWLEKPMVTTSMSLLYITGTEDPLNPMEGGRMKRDGVEFGPLKPVVREMIGKWSAMVGSQKKGETFFENEYVENVSYSKEKDPAKVFCIFVKNLGHYWPGGNPSLSEDVGGTKKNLSAINATQVIWNFFALHQKNG